MMGYSRMAALKGKYSRGTAAANEAITKMLLEKNHMERDWESDKVFMEQMYDRQDAHNEKMMKLGGPVDFQAIRNRGEMITAGINQVFDSFAEQRRRNTYRQEELDSQRQYQSDLKDLQQMIFDRTKNAYELPGVAPTINGGFSSASSWSPSSDLYKSPVTSNSWFNF